jgi:hypothetical protein
VSDDKLVPFTVGYSDERFAWIDDAAGNDVACVERLKPGDVCDEDGGGDYTATDQQWQAIIELIHAAPLLLVELKRLVDYCKGSNQLDAIVSAVAAIDKLEGMGE